MARRSAVMALALAAAAPAVAETDLSIAWIGRLPRIDYVWNSARPDVEGWPKEGRRVRWVAHVRNLDSLPIEASWRWSLDGDVVRTGRTTFAPGGITRLYLPRKWERRRAELLFEVDPDGEVAESEERNNRLLTYTDALAVGFWVERTFWERIGPVIVRAGIGATTFEDWMQKRIRQYNEMAALAKYPETPRGVVDRWRIDAVHIVPDGALPISQPGPEVRDWGAPPSAYPTLYPDTEDRTIDMQWGFPAYAADWYADFEAWQLLYDSQVHELGHARYLIDVYGWNVSAQNDEIGIVPPPPTDPYGNYHYTPDHGLMNTSWGFIDRHSAGALNRIAGHRATQGHYNEPTNIGEYLNDLPGENLLRLVSPEGEPFRNRRVRLYRASGEREPDWESYVLRLKIDGVPDREYRTDRDGAIQVGRNPFADGPIISAVDQNNTLAIVEVVDRGVSHFGYLEVRDFNLAYWRGETDFAEHELVMGGPVCPGPGLGPNDVGPAHEALVPEGEVTFEWPASRSQQFELRYSVDGKRPRSVRAAAGFQGGRVTTQVPLHGQRVAWWLVYKEPFAPTECPPVRSSTYFFDLQPRE